MHIKSSGNMEILTDPSDSTAAGPRWVLLNRNNEHDYYSSSGDAKTMAASCTSSVWTPRTQSRALIGGYLRKTRDQMNEREQEH